MILPFVSISFIMALFREKVKGVENMAILAFLLCVCYNHIGKVMISCRKILITLSCGALGDF